MTNAYAWRLGSAVANSMVFEGLITEAWVGDNFAPTPTNATTLYNGGVSFDMIQQSIAPINPIPMVQFTGYWNGNDFGTEMSIASALPSTLSPRCAIDWTGALGDCPRKSSVRPAGRDNTYSRFAKLAASWAAGVAIDGITPIGATKPLETLAPHFLPYPQVGWGAKDDATGFVGLIDAPLATPQLTVSGTLSEAGMSNNPNIGTGTMQGALDGREVRRLRPTFAQVS